jgi:hypothetical protein
MLKASLSQLVAMVRAEAGHSISVAQGLNTLDQLKHVIKRTEYELWTAYNWPQMKTMWDITAPVGQYEFAYPEGVDFDQIREVFYISEKGTEWTPVEYGIPMSAILPNGAPSKNNAPRIQLWDTFHNTTTEEDRIRVWPVTNSPGYLRLVGQRKLPPMVADEDLCTLDAVAISLFASQELLTRAKAEDAGTKMQKAQRHLQKLFANTTSDKQKVSTYGATRSYSNQRNRLRPGIDFIA